MNYSAMKKHGNLFLVEFMIVLFFFLIISTICIRIFMASWQTTAQTDARSHAQALTSEILEIFSADWEQAPAFLQEEYPQAIMTEESATLSWDRDFQETTEENSFYRFTFSWEKEEEAPLLTLSFSLTDRTNTQLYELEETLHTPSFFPEDIL